MYALLRGCRHLPLDHSLVIQNFVTYAVNLIYKDKNNKNFKNELVKAFRICIFSTILRKFHKIT